jgi:hypothetical protein
MATNTTHLSSRMVFLNSDNAWKSLSSSEKIFLFDDVIYCPPTCGMTLKLKSLQFCNSAYTIGSQSNKIRFTVSSSPAVHHDIVIEEGFYNSGSFLKILQAQVTAKFDADVVTAAYSTITGKFSFTYAGPSGSLGINPSGTTCFEPLGFPRGRTDVLPSTGLGVANFSGLNSLYFEILNIPTSSLDTRTRAASNTLARVNADSPSGSMVYFTDTSSSSLRLNTSTLNVFHCRLTDRYGSQIDFNSIPWEASLVVDFFHVIAPRDVQTLEKEMKVHVDQPEPQPVPMET